MLLSCFPIQRAERWVIVEVRALLVVHYCHLFMIIIIKDEEEGEEEDEIEEGEKEQNDERKR